MMVTIHRGRSFFPIVLFLVSTAIDAQDFASANNDSLGVSVRNESIQNHGEHLRIYNEPAYPLLSLQFFQPVDPIEDVEELPNSSRSAPLPDNPDVTLEKWAPDAITPECRKTVQTFLAQLKMLSQRYGNQWTSRDWISDNPEESAVIKMHLQAWDSQCLNSDFDQVPSEYLASAGVIKFTGSATSVVCSATLITSEYLVTARHCFFKPENNNGKSTADDLVHGLLSFSRAAEPDKEYKIEGFLTSRRDYLETFATRDDVIVLNLSQPIPGYNGVSHYNGAIAKFSKLWQFGYNGLLALFEGNSPSTWLSYFRWTGPESCRALIVNNDCIKHSCQTHKLFSGSGLLSQVGDQKKLVGVHSGAYDMKQECLDIQSNKGNIAVTSKRIFTTNVASGREQ